jgi:UDP-3-O-[3-hydroxymyristoyl] glucosamine N-acyltransferase
MELASSWSPLSIIRNGSFSNLGFLSNPHSAMLTFVESSRFARHIQDLADVACVVTTPELANSIPDTLGLAVCSNPRRAFLEIHNHLATQTSFYWSDFESRIDPGAHIHPRAVLPSRNVVIGEGVVVEPNVVIAERTEIGANCFLQAGVVLGSEGFQIVRADGGVLDMVHAGGIRIGSGVRILANSVISRGMFRQFTTIGMDARIGNLAYISHNVVLGRRASVGHGATVNGGVNVADDASIGPGATIATGISIGAGARVSIGSTVVRDVSAGETVMGMVALESRKMFRAFKEIERRR